MLTVPMVVNTLLYYLFMNVAFGYLAIILALCIFFVFPSMSRCEAEVGMGGDEEGLGDAAGNHADAAAIMPMQPASLATTMKASQHFNTLFH